MKNYISKCNIHIECERRIFFLEVLSVQIGGPLCKFRFRIIHSRVLILVPQCYGNCYSLARKEPKSDFVDDRRDKPHKLHVTETFISLKKKLSKSLELR